jgi:deoxycytidine triphosphate deaminase
MENAESKEQMSQKPDKNRDPRFTGVLNDLWCGSVLLSDEIVHYVENYELIDHESYNKENLRPASYNLTLGSDCRLGGKPKILSKDNRYLQIPPYEIVVVSTREKLKLPRFLIGRWNIRVANAYEGLLWVGGPQVDPGYEGHLYAPIYNLSKRTVILEWNQPFATIDFVRTTPFEKECIPFIPKREDTLAAHDIHQLTSGPREVWQAVDRIDRRMDTFQTIVFSLIALIFAALAIMASLPQLAQTGVLSLVEAPMLMLIIAAVIIFIAGWVLGRNTK